MDKIDEAVAKLRNALTAADAACEMPEVDNRVRSELINKAMLLSAELAVAALRRNVVFMLQAEGEEAARKHLQSVVEVTIEESRQALQSAKEKNPQMGALLDLVTKLRGVFKEDAP